MNFSVFDYTYPISSLFDSFKSSVRGKKPYVSQDSITVNSELASLMTQKNIQDMLNSNLVIIKLLEDNKLPIKADINNFMQTTYKHSLDTKEKAIGIYNSLPIDLKAQANLEYIQKGALLHDIGKVFIPQSVLNKDGKLNERETNIMHLHSKLSEAMLATQNVKPEVINIVKYHHQNHKQTGYPEINGSIYGYDLNTEIVALADKYSALTEQRSYKKALTPLEALDVIKVSVDNGEINPRVYNALVGYINNSLKKVDDLQKSVA